MKLISPYLGNGFNVTYDNYFTFLDLSLRLAKRECNLVGTIRANQRKSPYLLKQKRMLHDTMVVHFAGDTTVTVISYQ